MMQINVNMFLMAAGIMFGEPNMVRNVCYANITEQKRTRGRTADKNTEERK